MAILECYSIEVKLGYFCVICSPNLVYLSLCYPIHPQSMFFDSFCSLKEYVFIQIFFKCQFLVEVNSSVSRDLCSILLQTTHALVSISPVISTSFGYTLVASKSKLDTNQTLLYFKCAGSNIVM